MPPAALVSKSIFCMHGGLSPSMMKIEDILAIERPCDIPVQGLLCDLLWADPDSSNNMFE